MPQDVAPVGKPIRVPLSELEADPRGRLETARRRRVLPTRRGRASGEPAPVRGPRAAPSGPLGGALRDRLSLAPDADPTAPAHAEWEALA